MASNKCGAKCSDGSECEAYAMDSGRCRHHGGKTPTKDENENVGADEGNQNAMKTGVNSDPVNLFNWLAEHEQKGLAYILNKLYDYSKRAPQPVFEIDVSKDEIECFEDAETALTAYGDDLLLMCIRDYVRWRGSLQQVKEGLTTEQTRSGETGTYTVTDGNPVNLELDRIDRTTMQQKDKLGLMSSPEQQKADAEKELGEVVRQALE